MLHEVLGALRDILGDKPTARIAELMERPEMRALLHADESGRLAQRLALVERLTVELPAQHGPAAEAARRHLEIVTAKNAEAHEAARVAQRQFDEAWTAAHGLEAKHGAERRAVEAALRETADPRLQRMIELCRRLADDVRAASGRLVPFAEPDERRWGRHVVRWHDNSDALESALTHLQATEAECAAMQLQAIGAEAVTMALATAVDLLREPLGRLNLDVLALDGTGWPALNFGALTRRSERVDAVVQATGARPDSEPRSPRRMH